MSDTPPDRAAEIRAMTDRIKNMATLQSQIVQAAEECQSVLLFAGHPELTQLDDELDNLYPDAAE